MCVKHYVYVFTIIITTFNNILLKNYSKNS